MKNNVRDFATGRQIGKWQLVELMAQVLGTTVDPSDMLELQGDSQDEQGLSQMATQDC